jgi:hypothetical protein
VLGCFMSPVHVGGEVLNEGEGEIGARVRKRMRGRRRGGRRMRMRGSRGRGGCGGGVR